MDMQQAKEKLNSVSTGTALRHHKLLIADLCMVVKFLLDELEKTNQVKPAIVPLPPLDNIDGKRLPILKPEWSNPNDPKYGSTKPRKRMGNAGDAE